jgi:cephalosporin hydroxylase
MSSMPPMEDCLRLPLKEVLGIMQARILHQSTYFGIRALKSPIDFWIYQEILFETRPDFVIEIGNCCGGSTLALAHLCDCLGKGQVVALDVTHEAVPDTVRRHPRIQLIAGDARQSFPKVRSLIPEGAGVMIIEDSAHTFENTLGVLNTYSELIRPGGYFVVEDGIINHGLDGGVSPGPYEAIGAFVENNPDFEIDRGRESFLITWNPKGYLRRLRDSGSADGTGVP